MEIDMCFRHKVLKWEFELDMDKWDTVDPQIKTIVATGWKIVKFMDDDGKALNKEIETVPDDKGGIYSFVLSTEIMSPYPTYIMYIGRARRRANYSLRKRCKTYLKDERIEIKRMRETLGSHLYLRYLPLEDDQTIEKVERELIRVFMPPCNSDIPDYNVLPKKPAF